MHSLEITVKCPSGSSIPLSVESNAVGKVLFESLTGVPANKQMLYYKMRLLRPDISLQHYDLENGCCIDLSVKGVGVGGDSGTGISLIQ